MLSRPSGPSMKWHDSGLFYINCVARFRANIRIASNIMIETKMKLLLASSSLSLAAGAALTANASTSCAPYHLILARGTTESYPGTLGSLAFLIMTDFPSANYENLIYPATDESGSDSYFEGRRSFETQLYNYTTRCPNSSVVVAGYSQVSL